MSGSRISEIVGGNVIQSDRDLYTEDLVIQKMIYFVSLFSDDVKEYLNRQRSKEGLLQIPSNETSIDYNELQLDNLDDELVSVLLDMLENFDMFRLCLVICNKYNLKNQISRYLTSTCYKYSNLKYLDMNKILKMNDSNFRMNQKQVNVLANEAIHNLLKLIDPVLIKQQRTEDITKDSKLL